MAEDDPGTRWLFGPFELDAASGRLTRGGRERALARKPRAILLHLLRHRDRVVGQRELLQAVWPDVRVSRAAFASAVRDLRRALGQSGDRGPYVETVRGLGLRFCAEVHVLREAPQRTGAAGDPSADAWRAASGDLERALRDLDLLDRARGAAGPAADPGVARAQVQIALAGARWASGSTRDARRIFAEAAELGRRSGDVEIFARAALGYAGRTDATPGGHPEAIALLEEALERLAGSGPPDVRAEVLARLGTELAWVDPARADALTVRALAEAEEVGDPAGVAYALTAAHFVRDRSPDPPDRRLALADRAVALVADRAPCDVRVLALQQRCVDLLELGDGDGWRAARARHAEASRQLGQPFFLWIAELFAGLEALLDGRLEQAEARARTALERGRRLGSANAMPAYAAQLFSIRRQQGRLGELAPLVDAVADQTPGLPVLRAGSAAAWMARGDAARARAAAEAALAPARARAPGIPSGSP